MSETDTRKGCSDSGVDAFAAVALITIVIVAAVFWLTNQ